MRFIHEYYIESMVRLYKGSGNNFVIIWVLSIDVQHRNNFYRPQTKLLKGNVFTSVCQKFCPQGVCIPACTGTDSPPPQADTPRQTPCPRADTSGQTLLVRHPLGRHPPGRHTPPQADTPPPRQTPPLPTDGYCSRRYASYWNAFLYVMLL